MYNSSNKTSLSNTESMSSTAIGPATSTYNPDIEKKAYNDDSIYEGIQDLFEDDSIYDGIQNLFEESLPEQVSENVTINEADYESDVFSDTTSRFHDDNAYIGIADMFAREEWNALYESGYAIPEEITGTHESVRLVFEGRIREHYTQRELDLEGLNYSDLSDLMFDIYEDTLDEYEGDWGNLDDAIINLTEIADRHQDIIANPVPDTIPDQIADLGLASAFEFMVQMCMDVYNLHLTDLLGL